MCFVARRWIMSERRKTCPKCHFTMEEGKNTLALLPMSTTPGGEMAVASDRGAGGLAVVVFCCTNCQYVELFSFDIRL